jgi:Na+-translocating ferredoxin:NAD+ oxidoreductase subunit B
MANTGSSDDSIYRRLQQDLDRMPVGFPATETGVEIRILRQLFSPEEAAIALGLSLFVEPATAVHRRLNFAMTRQELAAVLQSMAHRGLIREHRGRAGGEPRYAKLPFVIGIYEGQVDRMTEELARDLLEYFELGLGQVVRPKKTPQLRTVPVNRPIDVERGVGRYDDMREAVRTSPGPFAVMNCICRQAKDLVGEPCRQTQIRRNCLTLGSAARTMMEHGQAEEVTRERMLGLLDEAGREGLVLQPQNTKNPLFVCCCCGCCCVALGAAKHLERPVEFFAANYYAEVDEKECTACAACLDRCQMDALAIGAETVRVDLARCIGCGLCLSSCPSDAMTLRGKEHPTTPPDGTEALYLKIYRERYGASGLAKAALARLIGRA